MLQLILSATVIYLLGGFIFSIAFLLKGITMIDESAKGAGIGFRLIILPGIVVFWPLLLKKWITKKKLMSRPEE